MTSHSIFSSPRPLLARALAWTTAVWLVHIVLRIAVLARPDAFGLPFVGKFDWYIFHAVFFDLRWISWISILFIAHVAFWERRRRWWAGCGLWALYVLHGALLVATLIDDETYRFMGCHTSPSFMGTYGNGAAVRQVFFFLASDKGGRYLPLVLLAAIFPLVVLLTRFLRGRAMFSDHPRLRSFFIAAILLNAVGWLYTQVIWTGGFRAKKLAPVVEVWWTDLHEKHAAAMDDATFQKLTQEFRARWKAENGADTLWDFPDPKLPYWKVPRGGTHVAPPDSQWNVVLIVLESHRALNCGFLRPYGAVRDATPFLDAMAPRAEIWTRYQCPALPTVRALASIHLGILNHPSRNFTSDNPSLANEGFSAILRHAGWQTRFFSAADPAWDNQTPWLRQWYDGFDYDRTREADADLFAHGADWMRRNLHAGKPFFVAFMSKTNHYPFNPEPGVEAAPHGDLQARMQMTMRYTERSVERLVSSLRHEPWFARTVFIITGDHGFPLGEHGSSSIGYGLYAESDWLPLVIFGNHPALHAGAVHAEPASHLDLGPTILALAGVRAPNHFTGRDLLLPPPPGLIRTTTNGGEFLVTGSGFRFHGSLDRTPREHGEEAFGIRDIRETKPVAPPREAAAWRQAARNEDALLQAVLQRDALAPHRH